jgi:hypothetical protein
MVEKYVGNKQLGRSRSSWEDNIKMNVKEIRSKGVCWI